MQLKILEMNRQILHRLFACFAPHKILPWLYLVSPAPIASNIALIDTIVLEFSINWICIANSKIYNIRRKYQRKVSKLKIIFDFSV